jgi:hypothetical protein
MSKIIPFPMERLKPPDDINEDYIITRGDGRLTFIPRKAKIETYTYDTERLTNMINFINRSQQRRMANEKDKRRNGSALQEVSSNGGQDCNLDYEFFD